MKTRYSGVSTYAKILPSANPDAAVPPIGARNTVRLTRRLPPLWPLWRLVSAPLCCRPNRRDLSATLVSFLGTWTLTGDSTPCIGGSIRTSLLPGRL